jgi:TfoX/Sxy family transcriptional regulator of competence genes
VNVATSQDFIEYVTAQIADCGVVRYKKMFGEYMVYVNDKPILLVCDNSVFAKPVSELASLLSEAEMDYPYSPEKYPGVKKHYVIDADNAELLKAVVFTLEPITPVPKPRKKKGDTL